MRQLALQLDGFCHGPLFAPPTKRRTPRRDPRGNYWLDHRRARRAAIKRATPAWYEAAQVRALYREAEHLTREAGTVWSVAHLVPLQSPWVCGLHWHGNMKLQRLEDNMRDSNLRWPDMWETQAELYLII